MPVTLITDPGSASIPLLPTAGRSSLQNLRRMAFLRWSAGEFLSAVANNRGFRRPDMGHSDDDYFRGVAQALVGEYKAVSYSLEALIEIALGPYEDMFFELDGAHIAAANYLQYDPWGDYVEYSSVAGGPFTVGERIEAIHPVTRKKTVAIVKEHDTVLTRIFFTDESLPNEAKPFDTGHTITGIVSGATAVVSGSVVRRDHYAFPLYGKATIDPGGANEEEVTFVAPDPYIGRVRLVTNLVNAHAAGTQIKITGGCWEMIDTQARRIIIRVSCLRDTENSLPGNSYIHPNPYIEPTLRSTAVAADTTLLLDSTVLETVAPGAFPISVILNPENDHPHTNSFPAVVEATVYTIATQTLTVPAGLPAGVRYVRGTKVKWHQARKGAITVGASATDTTIEARCRWENPQGVWRLDPGGVDENIFIKKTSYQKRQLTTEMVNGVTSSIFTDHPFNTQNPLFTPKLAVSDPVSGHLGFVDVQSIVGNEVFLTTPPGFSTDIIDPLKPTTLEMVKDTSHTVLLELSTPLANAHLATVTMTEMLGTNSIDPSYSDHAVNGDWPPSDLTRWPGPHVYDPTHRSPINTQASGLATAELDQTLLTDYRIYLANEFVSVDYRPSKAPASLMGSQFVPSLGVSIPTTKLVVSDGNKFPTQASVNYWRFTDPQNTAGDPPELSIGNEGGFGKPKVYLFGRGAAGTVDENVLYVGNIQRNHSSGTEVKTYTVKIPVTGAANVFGGDPGFSMAAATVLLDHATMFEEEVDYSSIETRTTTSAFLVFSRGFSPQFSHDPTRTVDIDSSINVGVPIVRADTLSIPRTDGFSFPFYLNGGLTLRRLKTVLDLTRAAGVRIYFVDENDAIIPV